MSDASPPRTPKKLLSLTQEVIDRLAQEPNASALIERLLREHFGMPPRPDLSQRGRWKPGQDPRRRR